MIDWQKQYGKVYPWTQFPQTQTQQPVAQTQPTAQAPAQSALPLWSRQGSTLPRPPFMDVLGGQRSAFRPGGLAQIPSAQRYGRLSPTEQEGAASYFDRELGIPWDDIAGLMQRLRPQGFSSLPRWSGGGF